MASWVPFPAECKGGRTAVQAVPSALSGWTGCGVHYGHSPDSSFYGCCTTQTGRTFCATMSCVRSATMRGKSEFSSSSCQFCSPVAVDGQLFSSIHLYEQRLKAKSPESRLNGL